MSSEIITKNDLKAILDTALPTQPVLVDSGWKTATLSSAFANYSERAPLQFRRVGKTVEIRGAVKPTAEIAVSDTWYTIFTLPLGYRPSRPKTVTQQGSGASIWLSSVDANGNVSFSRYRSGTSYVAAPTTVWLNLYLNFLIDDDAWPVTPVTTADYVIEQGTDGIWTYRKWSSGIAECWGKWTGTVSSGGAVFGGYQYATDYLPYPTSLFVEEPNADVSGRIGTGHCLTGTLYGATSSSIKVWAVTQVSGAQSCEFFIRAIGKWK